MKKLVLPVFFLLLLLLTACSGETPAVSGTPAATTAPQTDGGTVLTVLSWNPPLDGALDALSGTLAEKGLSVTFDVRLLRPDFPSQTVKAYAEQLPQSDLTMFYDYAAMCAVYDEGLLADLSGYADACPLLFASASDAAWSTSDYHGASLGYPLTERSSSVVRANSVLIREDIVEALGMELPETPEELLALCLAAREQGLPCELVTSAAPPYAFQRTYDDWPFFVDGNSLALFDGDSVRAYPGSDIFDRDREQLSAFGREGVLRLLLQSGEINAFQSEWDALACLYPISVSTDCAYAENIRRVQFAPEKEYVAVSPNVFRWVSLSASCAHPETALDFLTLLYTDSEVYDAFVFGLEGTHWKKGEDGVYEILTDNPFGTFFGSALEMNRSKYPASGEAPDDRPVSALDAGEMSFRLDTDALGRVLSCRGYGYTDSSMLYIRAGLASEDRLDAALRALEDAGLAGILETLSEQYAAHTAGK